MTKGEQVEMQRAAVRTYCRDRWNKDSGFNDAQLQGLTGGPSQAVSGGSCDERVLARLFPMPTPRMRDRTVSMVSREFGGITVYVMYGNLMVTYNAVTYNAAAAPRLSGAVRVERCASFATVEGLVAAGFVSDPNDVFRLQELLANPMEAVGDDV